MKSFLKSVCDTAVASPADSLPRSSQLVPLALSTLTALAVGEGALDSVLSVIATCQDLLLASVSSLATCVVVPGNLLKCISQSKRTLQPQKSTTDLSLLTHFTAQPSLAALAIGGAGADTTAPVSRPVASVSSVIPLAPRFLMA